MSRHPNLLASSSTIEGIQRQIEQFFAGTKYDLLPDGSLRRVSDGYVPGVIVRKKAGRYRLEVKGDA